MKRISLYTDGGARGNPGIAGCGWVGIDNAHNSAVEVFSGFAPLGIMTNNQAEYEGLLRGLTEAKERGYQMIDVHMDSELIIKQLLGQYKVKNPHMKVYFNQVCELVSDCMMTYTHVRRELNKRADELSNQGMDTLS